MSIKRPSRRNQRTSRLLNVSYNAIKAHNRDSLLLHKKSREILMTKPHKYPKFSRLSSRLITHTSKVKSCHPRDRFHNARVAATYTKAEQKRAKEHAKKIRMEIMAL